MYTVIRRYTSDPSSVKEAVRRVQSEFVPMISKARGFLYYGCVDSGDGTLTSISTFEDKSGADESTRMAAGWVRDRISNLLPNPPEVTAGENVVNEMAEQGQSGTTQRLRRTA